MVNTLVTSWFSLHSKISFFWKGCLWNKLFWAAIMCSSEISIFYDWPNLCAVSLLGYQSTSPLICHDIPLYGCTVSRNQLSLKFPGEVRLWMRIKLHLLFSSFWPGRVWKQAVSLFSLQWLHFFVPYGYIYVLYWVRPLTAFKSRMVSVPEREQFSSQARGLSLILEKWLCF